MEKPGSIIPVSYTNPEVNALLRGVDGATASASSHFNQSEEFFLSLSEPLEVPSLPIHHDVRVLTPEAEYIERIRGVLQQVVARAPQVVSGLTYLFDPTDILRPVFFQLYKLADVHYLYQVRLDLKFRPQDGAVVKKGSNDLTPRYTSNHLYLEPTFIPLEKVIAEEGKIRGFVIRQTISQTWIGERGRDYFVHGTWMDDDLTKFFTKLFLPPGKPHYPFYPFVCKYRTICMSLVEVGSEDRKRALPALHRALAFVVPQISVIQDSLRDSAFDEKSELFQELRKKVPTAWAKFFREFQVRGYLNRDDMKEFEVARVPT